MNRLLEELPVIEINPVVLEETHFVNPITVSVKEEGFSTGFLLLVRPEYLFSLRDAIDDYIKKNNIKR
ncbi:MAG: hypothetical protein HDS09_05485 [Bacteroides sp.]|nr:hypothetical protein [Bacteroides sp.]